jgi:tetratricopeptide (TPR) repeat protein
MKHSTSYFLAAIVIALSSACSTMTFGHRDPDCNPDSRLAKLMSHYQDCRSGHIPDGQDGQVLFDCDRVPTEIAHLLLEFPNHVPTLMANAVIAYDAHDPAQAEHYLDRALAAEPIHPEAAILKSRIAIEMGNLPNAKRLLEEQVHLTPDHAGLRESYSAVLYLTGDLRDASAQLDAAERLGAPAWRVAFNRGLIAEKAGDAKKAQQAFEASVAANPDFKPAQSRLAGKKAESGYNANPSPPGKTGGL